MHISEAYLEVPQGFYQKIWCIIICICHKINILLFKEHVFTLKSEGSNMNPWSTPYSIFNHVLKDNFFWFSVYGLTNNYKKSLKSHYRSHILGSSLLTSYASCNQMFSANQSAEHHNDPLYIKILSNFLHV